MQKNVTYTQKNVTYTQKNVTYMQNVEIKAFAEVKKEKRRNPLQDAASGGFSENGWLFFC